MATYLPNSVGLYYFKAITFYLFIFLFKIRPPDPRWSNGQMFLKSWVQHSLFRAIHLTQSTMVNNAFKPIYTAAPRLVERKRIPLQPDRQIHRSFSIQRLQTQPTVEAQNISVNVVVEQKKALWRYRPPNSPTCWLQISSNYFNSTLDTIFKKKKISHVPFLMSLLETKLPCDC